MSDMATVRSFNRFYTKQIGTLPKRYLDSPFSLAEVRVLYEIAHRDRPTAAAIAQDLDLDPGYLSRMVASFETRRLIARERQSDHGRSAHLPLPRGGRPARPPLDRAAARDIQAMLAKLTGPQRKS